ncbi:cysteine dioxygenase family protein [Actinokineospora sp. UTMC 2448]|uniref:cysteine dioxygenase n=1 Tax=Actinokineospora sp. UTMC 2448 TaxID=2268449 RepID=UPI0021640C71|nr:cysteine dioxygenase family protein [Actinokineospora sp. UTMC 2448]UVS80703.1 Cysteine dioxygenase [Actinokineospora sp. UTMC 2448]
MKVSETLLHPTRVVWSVRQLRSLTRQVGSTFGHELAEIARYDPRSRWWTRLALTEGVELWLLSWLPGQATPPHDHGGAAGSFTVVRGALTERYRYPDSGEHRGLRRAGETVAFGAGRAHVVANTSVEPALSVHAYSPPLVPTREYPSLAEIPARRVALPARRGSVVVEVP